MEVLVRPPSTGWMREEDSPSLVAPVANECEFTSVLFAASSTLFSSLSAPMPKDVARGFAWDPLIPDRGLSSIPSRYLIDWGVSAKNSPDIQTQDTALRCNAITTRLPPAQDLTTLYYYSTRKIPTKYRSKLTARLKFC